MTTIVKMNVLLSLVILVSSLSGCNMFWQEQNQNPQGPWDQQLTLKTNRTEGIAPLSVSFDLTDTDFPDDDMLMLAEFMWDFGDDGDPYNIGKGFCPAHVYREPGNYRATVTGYLDDLEFSKSVNITVTEFSGTTYYISADGNDVTGDGSMSNPFATPSYAFDNYTAPNVRFLLRQGDVFTKDAAIIFGRHGDEVLYGPLIVSSYLDPDNPSDEKPIIYDSRNDEPFSSNIALLNVHDYRFVNIKLQGAGGNIQTRDTTAGYPSGFVQSSTTPSRECLFLDCDVQGAGSISFHIEGEYNVVQDCTVRDGGSYGVFVTEGINCAFIGMSMKEFSNHNPEYTMRLSTHIVGNYIAYCDMWGDYTKCTFQIRGDDSSYNYVWNNQFDRFVGINQTNKEENETLHHNTFDSNITVMRNYEGNTYGSYDQRGFFFSSNNSMCRNNIVYGFDTGFFINTHDIVGGCSKLWYHNNTVIALRENACFLMVNKDAENVELRNNVFYNLAESSSYGDRFINVVAGDSTLSTDLSQIDSDFNIFIGEAWSSLELQTLVGVAYFDADPELSSWREDFQNGQSSIYADALLNTTIDTDNVSSSLENGFAEIGAGSPAIGAGDPDFIYSRFDFFGNQRSSLSLGAIE